MKKTLLALSLALAAPAAFAASSITLYGQADAGVTVQKLTGQDATVSMSGGNWYSNLWGIKGQEELGGGNTVFFRLEQGYNIDTGAAGDAGKAFSRQSYLGVEGTWGQIAFGRMGALGSDNGNYSILGGSAYTTSFSSIGDIYSAFIVTDWMSNTIVYQSPEFSGLTVSAMYSNGIEEDDQPWSDNSHYYGLGLTYSNGAFSANAIWEMLDNRLGDPDVKNPKATQLFTLGASYEFPAFTLYGSYQYALHSMMLPNYTPVYGEDQAPDKGANQNAFSLSVSKEIAGGTAMLQGQMAFGKLKDTGEKYDSWSVGAAYLYPLSKRTLVYVNANVGDTGKAFKQYDSGLRGWSAMFGLGHTF